MATFSLCPHVVERRQESTVGLCYKTLFRLTRAPPSWPNHLPKVSPPNTITLQGRISTHELGWGLGWRVQNSVHNTCPHTMFHFKHLSSWAKEEWIITHGKHLESDGPHLLTMPGTIFPVCWVSCLVHPPSEPCLYWIAFSSYISISSTILHAPREQNQSYLPVSPWTSCRAWHRASTQLSVRQYTYFHF